MKNLSSNSEKINLNVEEKDSTFLKTLREYQPVIAIFSAFMIAGSFFYNFDLQVIQLSGGLIFFAGFYGIFWIASLSFLSTRDTQFYRDLKDVLNVIFIMVVFTHLIAGIGGIYLSTEEIKSPESLFIRLSSFILRITGIIFLPSIVITLILRKIYNIIKKRCH